MADKRYIDADALAEQMLNRYKALASEYGDYDHYTTGYDDAIDEVECFPAADVVEVEKVAEMLRAMFDDDCACNYNGNDEWLPHVCEYGYTECPDAPEDNGCWKQFVKHFLVKMDGERKEQT